MLSQGVITGRIDRLSPTQLRILKLSSALSATVRASILVHVASALNTGEEVVVGTFSIGFSACEMFVQTLTAERIATELIELERRRFLERAQEEEPMGTTVECSYRFRSSLTQDVVYGLMLAKQQQAVHKVVLLLLAHARTNS